MKIALITIPALALCIAAPAAIKASAHESQPVTAAAQYQDQGHDRDWDRAPDGYRDAQRQGFHEGMEAARRDFDQHRHADADDHRIFKHPPVDGDDAKRDFREGFKEGYHRAMDHMRHDHDEPHF
jgi:hypothetical protein